MVTDNKPLISIITPVYNVEKYLPQCIESVIHQDFEQWELWLVDDGSTDQSGMICDQYASKDQRIKVLHKENSGQADSRNVALKLATADLIGFVDSDDWVEPTMFGRLYRTLVEHQADIAMCGYFKDYQGKSLPSCQSGETVLYTHDEALSLILDDKVIKSFLWDKLFRKEVIVEPLPKSYYFEDYSTLFKWFAQARSVAFLQVSLYHYRQRASSTDHDQEPAKKYHFLLAEYERYSYLQKHGLLLEKKEEFEVKLVQVGLNIAKGMARHSKDRQAVRVYIEKIRQDLNEWVNPAVYGKLQGKYRGRMRKLSRSVGWFVFSMRFSALFSFNKGDKKYKLYE